MTYKYTLKETPTGLEKWYYDNAIGDNLSEILKNYLTTGEEEVKIDIYNPAGEKVDEIVVHINEILGDFYQKAELIEIINTLVEEKLKGK